MSQKLTVHFEKPIASAKILDNCAGGHGGKFSCNGGADLATNIEQVPGQDSEAQKTAFLQAYQALNVVVAKLNEFYDKVFVEHKDEIANLSVEIARKVLMQKVENGDYEIESIVKEALGNAPARHELVVHLNPEDLPQCHKLQQDDRGSAFAGIKLIADPSIGRAECLLETPKGIIKSFIDEHMERISEALQKVE